MGRIDAFGRRVKKRPVMETVVQRIRSLTPERFEELREKKQLFDFLDLKSMSRTRKYGSGSPKTTLLNRYLTISGKREIVGTIMGDALKEIARGRLENVIKKHGKQTYSYILNTLEIAGIADRKTGKIDINAVKKCLKENRILHKGEW